MGYATARLVWHGTVQAAARLISVDGVCDGSVGLARFGPSAARLISVGRVCVGRLVWLGSKRCSVDFGRLGMRRLDWFRSINGVCDREDAIEQSVCANRNVWGQAIDSMRLGGYAVKRLAKCFSSGWRGMRSSDWLHRIDRFNRSSNKSDTTDRGSWWA